MFVVEKKFDNVLLSGVSNCVSNIVVGLVLLCLILEIIVWLILEVWVSWLSVIVW